MKILLLSNWSINDGIARATLLPIIKTLAKDSRVKKVFLCTIENKNREIFPADLDTALHIPLHTSNANGIAKIFNLFFLAFRIRKILRTHTIDFVWCRGATAGGLGAIVNLIARVPFVVDSFEPHAQYMLDSRTWTPEGYKFRVQWWLEKVLKRRAKLLLPVSYKFHHCLIANGLPASRLFTFPCVVDLELFKFSNKDRDRLRSSLKIPHETAVGIYTGKFGGLYYAEEAFDLYRSAFDFWKDNFFLIILTEMDPQQIFEQLKRRGISGKKCFIHKAKHDEVPQYLSAADFAISTIKSVPALKYCSPIKHGEYWAADLPILTTLSFGDDADILRNEGGGVMIDIYKDDTASKFSELQRMIDRGRTGYYRSLAVKYRNPVIMCDAIQFVVENMVTKKPASD